MKKTALYRGVAASLMGLAMTAAMLPTASASGLYLPEGASSGYGTAGAGDGVNTDSAAVMWANPAAMAGLDGETLTINALLLDLGWKFEDQSGTGLPDSPNPGGILPSGGVFWATPINDDVMLGLALSSQGGSTFNYDGWEHPGTAAANETLLANLQFNPSLSYRLNDKWSVGAGMQVNYTLLSTETVWPVDGAPSFLTLDAAGDLAFGYTLGVFFEPNSKTNVGLSYRSATEHEFSGDATVNLISEFNSIPAGEYDSSYDYAFTVFAAKADLSASHQINDQWKILGSLGWQDWSSMGESDIILNDLNVEVPVDRNWQDTYSAALGAHYKLNSDWTLKAGVAYETSPLDVAERQTLDLPIGAQTRIAVGATTGLSNGWTVDMFYSYAHLGNPDINQAYAVGEFTDYRMHLIGASFTKKAK